MNNLQIITGENANILNQIGSDLAETYKVAFAGDPWYEASRCVDNECSVVFSEMEPGCNCPTCQSTLVEAYDSEELVSGWKTILEREDGYMEVGFKDGLPQRATIARPTTVEELYDRKYADNPRMRGWLEQRIEGPFVWIEDTFANRQRQASGNLNNRGETLQRVSSFYGGLKIATRTLSPAIIAATMRDAKPSTSVAIGENGVGTEIVNRAFSNPGYSLPTVPDRRTLLVISDLTDKRR